MWYLVSNLDELPIYQVNDEKLYKFIYAITEDDYGQVTVLLTRNIAEAKQFKTEKDALEYKNDFGLHAWTYKKGE